MRMLAALLLALVTVCAQADGQDEIVTLVEKYWEARNDKDYEAQLAMVSEDGMVNANSNGTFFTTEEKGTLEEIEEELSDIETTDVAVHNPEVVMLSDDVALAYYYLEGSLEFSSGERVANYRTRVTHTWVREGDAWKMRTWHFSALHGGGTVID